MRQYFLGIAGFAPKYLVVNFFDFGWRLIWFDESDTCHRASSVCIRII